jgi:hypothetical protein
MADDGLLRLGPSGRTVLVSTTASVDVSVEAAFDNQKRKGYNAARPKFLGVKPARISATIVLLDEADEAAFWRDVAPLLRARARNGDSPPLEIVSAPANRLGVRTVIVKSSRIGALSARDGRTVSIELQEWTPQPVEAKASTAAQTKAEPAGFPDAIINVFTNGT